MKLSTLIFAGFVLSVLATTPAWASREPRPGAADARIKTITYHESDVYRLRGHYGYTTVIELSPKERIETVSIGDSEGWQIIKPNRPNILFVKPLEQNAETNMTILTTKRIYNFEMSASTASSNQSANLTFLLKFLYPGETSDLENFSSPASHGFSDTSDSSISNWNFEYSYSGAKRLRPERAFDDGFPYLFPI